VSFNYDFFCWELPEHEFSLSNSSNVMYERDSLKENARVSLHERNKKGLLRFLLWLVLDIICILFAYFSFVGEEEEFSWI